nr:hypothetical protein [Tanacetum cinerariifolium]
MALTFADTHNMIAYLTWVLVDLPNGKRAIGTKWVFRNKKDERGIVVRNKLDLLHKDTLRMRALIMKKSLLRLKRYMFVNLQDLKTLIILTRFTKWSRHYMDYIKLLELGLQVKQKPDGIFISQDKYVAEILRKFRLTYGKSVSTLIDTQKPLLKDPGGEDVDVHTYRSMIGSLIYLTSSRPDIILISWQCKKKTVVATSSTEVEYVAAASYCAQVLWIQNQLLDYGSTFDVERFQYLVASIGLLNH